MGLPFDHSVLREPSFELGDQPLGRHAAARFEEVDRRDLSEPLAQPDDLRVRLGVQLLRRGRVEPCRKGACLLGDGAVVFIARRIEESPRLRIRKALDELRLADHRLAAALDDFLEQPPEILLRLGVRRQRVDRAFHRDRADVLQSPPDLHSEIGGLGRQLVNEEQPPLPHF